ncbi:MAG: hypothetical protein VYC39_04110 [Myxococcota bacterium]|nr:hypothetical protein [Myxococcota bacterium]
MSVLVISACTADNSPITMNIDAGNEDAMVRADATANTIVDAGIAAPKDSGFLDASTADSGSSDASSSDFVVADCYRPEIQIDPANAEIIDDRGRVTVTETGTSCQSQFALNSTQPQRDALRSQTRTINETIDYPVLRSGNPMFDALYSLSVEEVIQNSVAQVQDGSFNQGQPIDCMPGGCFQTGRLWKYVWTRDIAYATDLALASLDPIRARNSLLFKLSPRRDGTDEQIVQDTGTGGSYPVSTDRVSWILGAIKTLHYLKPAEQQAFLVRLRRALNNTISHDRKIAYDEMTGLYRGETSFLDWREQTYPNWVQNNVVHVGMSRSLSTNLLHLAAIEEAARLNQSAGESMLAAEQQLWGDSLRRAIQQEFQIENEALYSAFLPTELDLAPSYRFDLLALSFAITMNLSDEERSLQILEDYPHSEYGPPVIWPQQPDSAIYHNRAIWPFVTAYWLRAAKKHRQAGVVAHNIGSLVNATALNLSNMENLEFMSGLPYFEDGSFSGPVINSERQLWSVAAYVSMVHDVLFGIRSFVDALEFDPFITHQIHEEWFSGVDQIILNRFDYQGHQMHIALEFPSSSSSGDSYEIAEIHLNQQPLNAARITVDQLEDKNLLTIRLQVSTSTVVSSVKILSSAQDEIFAPQTPRIDSVDYTANGLLLNLSDPNPNPANLRYHIYRDGELLTDIAPSATYLDTLTATAFASHCYTFEIEYLSSSLRSQRSEPICYWGRNSERIYDLYAGSFVTTGGQLVDQHGWIHYQSWGEPGHSIRSESFAAPNTGTYLVQTFFGNGLGGLTTGITCAVKRLRVIESSSQTVVSESYLMMPHTGDWTTWRDSSFARVELIAGRSYDFVIDHNPWAVNMSSFEHFSLYTGGSGGSSPAAYVNIGAIRVLALTGNE